MKDLWAELTDNSNAVEAKRMHVGLAILSIITALWWSDRRHWKRYHSTMLYMTSGAFLYEYLTKDQTMWKFHPDFCTITL